MSYRLQAEDLELAIFRVLYEDLNAALTQESTRGTEIDNDFFLITGRGGVSASLEPFAPDNFHKGHRPSMILAPVSEYPSLAVMCYLANPAASQSHDQTDSLRLTCSIEAIVRSGPYPEDDRAGTGEDIVNRRAKRTGEAIHRVISSRRALDGDFMPAQEPPVVRWGEVFERDEMVEGRGARWYWQGVRLQYVYDSVAEFAPDVDQF